MSGWQRQSNYTINNTTQDSVIINTRTTGPSDTENRIYSPATDQLWWNGSQILTGATGLDTLNAVGINSTNNVQSVYTIQAIVTDAVRFQDNATGNILVLANDTTGITTGLPGFYTGTLEMQLIGGAIAMNSTGASGIKMDSDVGTIEINAAAGSILIGNDAVAQSIAIGTAGARTLTIGTSAVTSAVNIAAETVSIIGQPLGVGITSGSGPIKIEGKSASYFKTTTGSLAFDGFSGLTIDASNSGDIEINATPGTNILIGNDAGALAKLQLGNGDGAGDTQEIELNALAIDINAGATGLNITSKDTTIIQMNADVVAIKRFAIDAKNAQVTGSAFLDLTADNDVTIVASGFDVDTQKGGIHLDTTTNSNFIVAANVGTDQTLLIDCRNVGGGDGIVQMVGDTVIIDTGLPNVIPGGHTNDILLRAITGRKVSMLVDDGGVTQHAHVSVTEDNGCSVTQNPALTVIPGLVVNHLGLPAPSAAQAIGSLVRESITPANSWQDGYLGNCERIYWSGTDFIALGATPALYGLAIAAGNILAAFGTPTTWGTSVVIPSGFQLSGTGGGKICILLDTSLTPATNITGITLHSVGLQSNGSSLTATSHAVTGPTQNSPLVYATTSLISGTGGATSTAQTTVVTAHIAITTNGALSSGEGLVGGYIDIFRA